MALIVCDNIALAYDKTLVLSDLSFRVERGNCLCVVGENGSGKSTLMKALLGLMPVVRGKIELGEGLLRKEIAYLPQQNALQQDFPASVREIVLSGRLARKGFFSFYNREDKQIAGSYMEKLGIDSLADFSFRALSGGQQQRVLLARALAAEPELLLIDEPTAGLDPVMTADFYDLIGKYAVMGKTVVMVTHDREAVLRYATHVLHLHHQPLFFGSKTAYQNSAVGRKYLEDRHA